MPECTNCYCTAKYSFQGEPYCEGCLTDMIEIWEDENKDKILEGDVDFIVMRILIDEQDIFSNDVAERINKNYGLIIKRLKEENK